MATGASAETRTLKLFNLHTKEKAEITFKRNGRFDAAGLKQANNFLRDWRRNEPTKMNPRLLDLIWEAYKTSGSRAYINVVCGYRSPGTNSMLRSRSKGVAEKSQHMLGNAMDFFIPDVKLKTLREIGLRAQGGGVGYYPRSGSPFVHMDVGNVRHWPKMSRQELVAVFPNGKTLHIPSDGKPLPGFEQALASYQARKKNGTTALALASSGGKTRSGGLLAALFGRGADEDEDSAGGDDEGAVAVASAKSKPAKTLVAAVVPPKATGKIQIVPPELSDRVDPVAESVADPEETPESIIAALPAKSIPLPAFAPRPKVEVAKTEVAEAATLEPAPAPAVPFGMAQAETSDAEAPAIVAEAEPVAGEDDVNVPIPGWRPDHGSAVVADAGDQVLLAMAAAEKTTAVDAANAVTAGVPIPSHRPIDDPEMTVGAVPEARPTDAEEIAVQVKANNARLAMLTSTATPKAVVATLPDSFDPKIAISSGVKTTRKTARANARDKKPSAKPMVVAAQPAAARWALNSNAYVPAATAGADAPSVARHLVRAAPSEVYSSGFQQGTAVADAGKFSGKAISFMPVARFATN